MPDPIRRLCAVVSLAVLVAAVGLPMPIIAQQEAAQQEAAQQEAAQQEAAQQEAAQQEAATPAGAKKDYGEISRTSYAISQEILSPFCPGKTLAMCPSPAAAEVRREIQGMAEQGVEKEEIKARIIQTYGEEFRIVEPPQSDNLAVLIAIAIGLAVAIGAVIFISRRRKEEGAQEAVTATPAKVDEDDPYLAELRERYRD